MPLTDKVAVVTGASRGLGRALAEALLGRGAVVYGLARDAHALDEARRALGAGFHPVACDVTDGASVRRAFEHLRAEAGRCDVLVNNAGLGRYAPIEALEEADWRAMIETNLAGVIRCTQEAVPMMRAQNEREGFGGHIVNIASIAGIVGNPTLSVYNMTKFGVRGFSEALMKELREDRIKVTSVCPGSIATGFGAGGGRTSAPGAMAAEDVAATVLHVLEASPNYLVSEVVMRPLRPQG